MGVAELAHKYHKPVLAIVGKNELSEKQIASIGLQKIISLVDEKTNIKIQSDEKCFEN